MHARVFSGTNEASATSVVEALLSWVSNATQSEPALPGSRQGAITLAGAGESAIVLPQLPLPVGSNTPT